MSIEKILRLEAEKKRLALVPPALENKQDSVSKSKQEKVGVIKGKQEEVEVSKSRQVETSPTKNYTKVPNSVARQAIPEKFFRGLSKHTYDVLYLQTRGAIVPKRSVQLTKDELVKMTGLSKDAVKLHIRYLKDSGLIKSHPAVGSRAGWEYEVFVPEEIVQDGVSVSMGKEVSVSKRDENLPLHTEQNLLTLTPSNLTENKELSSTSKTSLKTNTKNDDETRVSEAFSVMTERLDSAVKKITGKGVSKKDAEKWGILADLLILELETAARRAGGVSSVPAFLTEVLRRQFFTSRQQQSSVKLSKTKTDTIGKSESGSNEIKSLDKEGRESALIQLQEWADDDEFLQSYKQWYTEEDWQWLMQQLGSN